jgi:hypothetical protein
MPNRSSHTLAELATDIFSGKGASRLKTGARGAEKLLVSIKDIETSIAPRSDLEVVRVAPGPDVERLCLHTGDVVITARGAVRAAVVREEQAGALAGANLVVVRLQPEIEPDVIAAYLRHPRVEQELLADFVGSVTPGFSVSGLRKLPIALPSRSDLSAMNEMVRRADQYHDAMLQAAEARRAIALELVQRALRPVEGDAR